MSTPLSDVTLEELEAFLIVVFELVAVEFELVAVVLELVVVIFELLVVVVFALLVAVVFPVPVVFVELTVTRVERRNLPSRFAQLNLS